MEENSDFFFFHETMKQCVSSMWTQFFERIDKIMGKNDQILHFVEKLILNQNQ